MAGTRNSTPVTRAELIAYCLRYPRTYEDYPFDDITDPGKWTVMRHRGNRKSFALIYERHGRLCLNLKCDPGESVFLRQEYASLTPGYHMNKVHWNTIDVAGDVPWDEVTRLIGTSYHLTRPTKERRSMRFDAVGIVVTDLAALVRFYRDIMGMVTEWAGEPTAELRADGFRLILYDRAEFEALTGGRLDAAGRGGTHELAFTVENFDAVDKEYDRVVGLGAAPVAPPATHPWGQRLSYVADPGGNLVQIGSFQEL